MKEALLVAESITKEFDGLYALKSVDLAIYPGEVNCIVGENGAGKSTLIKIMTGAYRPSDGMIRIKEESHRYLTPHMSEQLGIQVIYQESNLVNSMTVAENIFIGREKTNRLGIIHKKEMINETQALIEEYGLDVKASSLVSDLSLAEQQFVKILRALAVQSKILIMDEPTSMFNTNDAQLVLDLVRTIRDRGVAIIYISHHLTEVLKIADRITVLRDGEKVKEYDKVTPDLTANAIASEMVGRQIDSFFQKEKSEIGEVCLGVKDMQLSESSPKVSFELHRGEILGVAGMVGAGRSEIVRGIFGADPIYSGEIRINGEKVNIRKPKHAIKSKMALVSEDRHRQSLNLDMSAGENITMVSVGGKKKNIYSLSKSIKGTQPMIEKMGIRTTSPFKIIRYLSGGNQQKAAIAKWLLVKNDIIIFDEPTRGIDVNSKVEIYQILSELAKEGKAILMVSSDMPELIAMSDRIMIVKQGKIVAILQGHEKTEKNIIKEQVD
ncbi:MAG: sugar ABC transporter ATP-binding protein [Clostridiaceae bacterium]|nr:sugar ABC transporter ATP-binding protein [Clostridiaceae bacterium]